MVFQRAWDLMKADWWETMTDEELEPSKLQCNGREHIQLIEKDGILMTDCECEKGCLPTKMTPA